MAELVWSGKYDADGNFVAAVGGAGDVVDPLAARRLLAAQPWRGNVRELRNVLEQLMMRLESGLVDESLVRTVLGEAGVDQIAPPARSAETAPRVGLTGSTGPLWAQVAVLERQAVQAALQACGGNKVAAAKQLGISRAKLYQCLNQVV